MKRLILAGATALALAALTGCGDGSEQVAEAPGTTPTHTAPSLYSPPPQTYTPPPTTEAPPPPPPLPRLRKTDIALAIKVKSKHCFGSAGCNIEYDVIPTWVGATPIALDDDYDVTYVVNGGEDGPILDTFTFYAKGRYDVPYEGYASTSSSSKELTAHIAEVSPHLGY